MQVYYCILSELQREQNYMQKYYKQIYPYDLLVVAYLVFALILSAITGMKIDFSVIFNLTYDITFSSIAMLYLIIFLSILALKCRKNGDDTHIFGSYWRQNIIKKYLSYQTLFDLIRVIILLKITLLIYCNIKQGIPSINSNLYDSELLYIDRILFFGFNPNKVSVALLGNNVSAPLLDNFYMFWYMLKPLVLAYFAIIPDRKLHIRFYTAYFAMWIFGGIFALIIPSLGPIYTHPEWFKNLHIRFAPVLQKKLWAHYEKALINPEKYKVYTYEGIAALPSLHVGIIALFAFFIFKINRKIGIAMIAYTVILQIGSVLLGWHYALDGYAGILLAGALYYASQFVIRKS